MIISSGDSHVAREIVLGMQGLLPLNSSSADQLIYLEDEVILLAEITEPIRIDVRTAAGRTARPPTEVAVTSITTSTDSSSRKYCLHDERQALCPFPQKSDVDRSGESSKKLSPSAKQRAREALPQLFRRQV